MTTQGEASTGAKFAKWVVGGVSVVALLLVAYVVVTLGFAIFQFASTKSALMARGISAATAALIGWGVLLISVGLPAFSIFRILIGKGKPLDYTGAMALPLISWGIAFFLPANFHAGTGERMTWCAPVRPDGTQHCSDGPGADPKTGRPMLPITTEAAEDQMRRDKNLVPEPVTTTVASTIFFDRIDGKPLVWYTTRSDGCFDFFNRSGVHPQFGTALLPVTGEVVERARRCEKPTPVALPQPSSGERRELRTPNPSLLKPPTPLATPEPDPKARYVDVAALQPGAKAVAFRGDPSIARELMNQLPQPLAVSTFKASFFVDGLFEQALMGDTTRLRSLRLGDLIDVVYLIQVEAPRIAVHQQLEGMVHTQVSVRFVAVDPRTGAVLKSSEQTFEGRGFSPQKALAEVRADVERRSASLLSR